jgi:hypothetical protein
MAQQSLTPELVVTVVTSLLALVMDLVPRFRKKWDALGKEQKRFAWLGGCLVVGVAPVGLACIGLGQFFDVACGADGLARGIQVGTVAYFSGQLAHGVAAVSRKAYAAYYRSKNEVWKG